MAKCFPHVLWPMHWFSKAQYTTAEAAFWGTLSAMILMSLQIPYMTLQVILMATLTILNYPKLINRLEFKIHLANPTGCSVGLKSQWRQGEPGF